jgi:hypothetical protein
VNKARRDLITQCQVQMLAIQGYISDLKQDLETARDEEQEYYDAMPEGLQGGEKGEKATAAIDALESAIGNVETMEQELDELEGYCDTAKE